VRICRGEEALTAAKAKELLGWTEETEETPFGADYLLKDRNKVKVRCYNNVTNRPLYQSNLSSIEQEITRGRFVFNGEPIIIGQSGKILNGQHTLIALVLVNQGEEEEIAIDKLIVFGVSEADEVVNTMDTCKSRTLSDVLYRSEIFKSLDSGERKKICRVCDYAIKTVWDRTGAENAFAPRKTLPEAINFLEAHPRLLEAVEFVYTENVENSIGRYLSPGYAAGMLYLMGCSNTDPEKYLHEPDGKSLNWDNWDKACEFFVMMSSGNKALNPLRNKLVKMSESEEGISRSERFALLAKAWLQFVDKGKVSAIKLQYVEEDGFPVLAEFPSVGGIDSPEES
jgi:hypothetical protein